MRNRGTLTKLLASVGTALAWFPILATGLLTLGRLGAGRMHQVDYLMPAELFPAVFAGGGLLLWAAVRAHLRRGIIGWGLAVAVGALIAEMALAIATGLASGEREPTGVWWALAVALLAVYTLAIPVIGTAGVLLLRDLFSGRSTKTGGGAPSGQGEETCQTENSTAPVSRS